MANYFDYLFYRIYSFYKKKGDGQPIIQSLNFVSLYHIVCVFSILQIIDKLSKGRISVSLLTKDTFWIFWASLIILVYVINIIRYVRKDNYKNLIGKYCNSFFNPKIKMWMIFIQPVFLLIITIALLVLLKA